jgi:hypothetical protein
MIASINLTSGISPAVRRATVYLIILTLAAFSCLDRINLYIDDVFITLRYVQNIIHGAGPVFNSGERLEAISNPVWMWLLVLLSKALCLTSPESILILAKSTAFILHGLASLILFELIASRSGKFFLSLSLAVIFAAHPFIATYAIAGLENSLIHFLLLIILFLMQKEEGGRTGNELWISVTVCILLLTRPEAIMYFPCYLLYLFWRKRSKQTNGINASITVPALIPAIGLALFAVWRYSFYGNLLPSTVYAKHAPQLTTFKEGA